MTIAKVIAPNDFPVKFRASPNTNGTILAQIPQGTSVEVLAKMDKTWSKIRYGDQTGYMMTKFLHNNGNLDDLKEALQKVLEILDKLED